MGIEVIIAGISAAAGVGSAIKQHEAQKDAAKAQKRSQQEQKAVQAAQAAKERRAQIREERVRRAKVLQASENTGTAESSGASGAVGNLSTQLGANLGFNLGMQQSASNITALEQSAVNHMNTANMWGQVGSVSQSIFKAAGGFNAFDMSQAPAPVQNGPTSAQ